VSDGVGTACYGMQTGMEWVQTVVECRPGWSGYRLLWNVDGDGVGTVLWNVDRDGLGTDCYGM